jgi:RNA polymerase sigma factor (TIGR02999 family)
MPTATGDEITRLLAEWSEGAPAALERLTPLVYQELRKLARAYLRNERAGHTLQPTALIHEAYMRLSGQKLPDWQGRKHFYGVAAQLMRQVLVEHARARAAIKRGGDDQKLPLEEIVGLPEQRAAELVALDDALTNLADFDPRKARVIELRFFGGMTEQETAHALGISVATVRRDMRLAEAWLRQQISQ